MYDNSDGRVLRSILELGNASRSLVARHARVSPATVTNHVRALIDAGLVVELPASANVGGAGRPHLPLALNTRSNVVLAVHIAAQRSTVAVVDIGGRTRRSVRIPHAGPDPTTVVAGATAALGKLRSGLPDGVRILGLGVATGGWVDGESGILVDHPFLGWQGTPLRDMFATATGLPTELDGHARGLLHAEMLFGTARNTRSAVVLFVGNVIDAAFALGGQVHYGPQAAAGSIGRMLGDLAPESPRRDLGDYALAARAARDGLIGDVSVPDLIDQAAVDGRAANRVFVDRATALGKLSASLLDFLNPETLIVADRSYGLPGVEAAYRTSSARSVIRRTSFAGSALVAASSAVALRTLYDSPLNSPLRAAV